jgi:hypothetical protein
MAVLADNSAYLSLDGVDVSGLITEVKPKGKNNVRETTHGAGATHVQRAAGLDDYSFDATVVYDDAQIATYIQKLKPGAIYTMEYAPEGRTAGKPKHVQSVIVEGNDHAIKIEKDMVAFNLSLLGQDAPTSNMYSGAVY